MHKNTYEFRGRGGTLFVTDPCKRIRIYTVSALRRRRGQKSRKITYVFCARSLMEIRLKSLYRVGVPNYHICRWSSKKKSLSNSDRNSEEKNPEFTAIRETWPNEIFLTKFTVKSAELGKQIFIFWNCPFASKNPLMQPDFSRDPNQSDAMDKKSMDLSVIHLIAW